ncbi:hypothetical protein [Rhizobium sp. AG207R]|uniref:hypothetical protein n=1 Tax=Rhizobium sp. AG207R TaxID=2802287 RepID=UPI0022AC6FF4|nr:hypothetical protein [Rhizobium sp. AG207R]MCZ3377486.1 hypothetical protein [Rhizobium sp. AG207R]
MTASALIKESDLHRMAKVAKRDGVTVWIEIDGKKIGVSPDIPANHREREIAEEEEIRL